ncbi:ribonuclease H-like domain-containing protein [Schizophyllum amplum]|uniref:Ribonuclease H-like domain-containing protein n=1 Tax=Schizophyllum amplum TaxID=97359 RepID=A0A550CAB5_9AGAR|nr:ribonuclease H-like domain-containing protein [Auriculariopsis ampla]
MGLQWAPVRAGSLLLWPLLLIHLSKAPISLPDSPPPSPSYARTSFGSDLKRLSPVRTPVDITPLPLHSTPSPSPPPSPLLSSVYEAQDVCEAQNIVTTKQNYDAFLVVDVEGTCMQGTNFSYPNEIIEFPVCLMRWRDKGADGTASVLEVVDTFHSYVRPTWRPVLSQFCTDLTGITQSQVDASPPFPDVLRSFYAFMIRNGLINRNTGKRLAKYCWVSDGPFDLRDFVVKQCFLSKITFPDWMRGDVLDVRVPVMQWMDDQSSNSSSSPTSGSPFSTQTYNSASSPPYKSMFPRRRTPNIPAQLRALGLPEFQGRQHSGIDDTRNICRILAELARLGFQLKPNTSINPERRWPWMGRKGRVLEEYV